MPTPTKLGSTILVEAISGHPQYTPSIAALTNGQFVVGWEDWFAVTTGPYSNYGIRAQYFNANGDESGGSFGIWAPDGVFFEEGAWSPDLIGLANGGFSAVYTWFSDGAGFQNNITQSDFSGTTATTFTELSLEEFGGADHPHQAQLTNDTTVVAWDQLMFTNVQTGAYQRVIYADIVTSSGAIVNTNRIVLSIASDSVSSPSVAALADGGFVITWQDDTNNTVWMQRYDASGNALGTTTQVPAHNSGTQSATAVAGLPDGQYVVAYVDTSDAYTGDTSGSAIVARVFNADGSAVTDFLVNTTSSGNQTEPAIVALADGRFFVAWVDASGAGGTGTDIRGQLFASNGSGGYVADGSELLIDTPGGNQDTPSLSVTPDGRILVSWQTTIAAGSGIDVQVLDPREHGMTFSATVAGEQFYGTAYNDVFYADADTVVTGGGGFDTVIETSPGVTLNVGAGTTLYQVQEVILNVGTNVVNGSYSSDFIYLYGGASGSANTLTLGSGGGYEISTGGTNHMFGDTNSAATDVFIGGIGSSDMHGGAGVNDYYIGASDTVTGAGVFNTLIELAPNVTLDLGTSHVQEVVLNGGTNSVDMTGSTDFDYLYGGAGTNTMTLGSGGGYELSTGGTNHMYGGSGAGTDVFVGGVGTSDMHGGAGNNVYYTGANDTVFGAGLFNTEVMTAPGVSLSYGTNLTDVQEVVLNAGTNTVNMTGSPDYVYLFGGDGTNTMTLGSGGGQITSTGGINHMFGSPDATGTEVFNGGVGASDMHGGGGNNVYYTGANDTVAGAGTYNQLVENGSNVTLTPDSAGLTDIQRIFLTGGNNTVDGSAATSPLWVWCGWVSNAGNDTIVSSSGNDLFTDGSDDNTFVFKPGWGQDSIWFFNDSAAASGIIDFTALAPLGVHSIADLTQTMTSIAGNLIDTITSSHTGASSIVVSGVNGPLAASSFHFG